MHALTGLIILITNVLITCLGMVFLYTPNIIINKLAKSQISPIRLHSASSVRISSSNNTFQNMLPTIRLSPLGLSISRKYTKPFNAPKRHRTYPNVSKCNAMMSLFCTHLGTLIYNKLICSSLSIIKIWTEHLLIWFMR